MRVSCLCMCVHVHCMKNEAKNLGHSERNVFFFSSGYRITFYVYIFMNSVRLVAKSRHSLYVNVIFSKNLLNSTMESFCFVFFVFGLRSIKFSCLITD